MRGSDVGAASPSSSRMTVVAALIALLPGQPLASFAGGSLDELIGGSSLIVVGVVEELYVVPVAARDRKSRAWIQTKGYDGALIARIRVLRSLKGSAPRWLHLFVTRTWLCDQTDAVPGETALFFLHAMNLTSSPSLVRDVPDGLFDDPFRATFAAMSDGAELHRIRWSGVGRMSVDAEGLADVDLGHVSLPDGMTCRPGSAPPSSVVRPESGPGADNGGRRDRLAQSLRVPLEELEAYIRRRVSEPLVARRQ